MDSSIFFTVRVSGMTVQMHFSLFFLHLHLLTAQYPLHNDFFKRCQWPWLAAIAVTWTDRHRHTLVLSCGKCWIDKIYFSHNSNYLQQNKSFRTCFVCAWYRPFSSTSTMTPRTLRWSAFTLSACGIGICTRSCTLTSWIFLFLCRFYRVVHGQYATEWNHCCSIIISETELHSSIMKLNIVHQLFRFYACKISVVYFMPI